MNYMEHIAELFGVRLDERFWIEGEMHRFKMTASGLKEWQGEWETADAMLIKLLTGYKKINLSPWRPKLHDEYWYVTRIGAIFKRENMDSVDDIQYIAFGNCFKNEYEAEANKNDITEKLAKVLYKTYRE